MPIELSNTQIIHKDKIEYKLYERHKAAIGRLRELGFENLTYTREVLFPFSAIPLFWIFPLAWAVGEILGIERPLRIVAFNPVLFNFEYDSYANISGFGVTFLTHFVDNTMLVTRNITDPSTERPDKKFFSYGMPVAPGQQADIAATWEQHIEHILTLEKKGRETDSHLTIETFDKMGQRGDRVFLGME